MTNAVRPEQNAQSGPDLGPHLHKLRTLVAVIEAQSIAGGAEALFCAPSAVSRTVADLERAVGLALVTRQWRGVRPTAAGEAVAACARQIMEDLTRTIEALPDARPRRNAAVAMRYLLHGRRIRLLALLASRHNIAAAAAAMGITPSGASMALARIEAQLGQPLFERRLQGMEPTPAGTLLGASAARALGQLRGLAADLAGLVGSLGTTVTVGAIPLAQCGLIPQAIAAALAGRPDLRVGAFDASYAQIVRALGAGEMDAGIVMLRGNDRAEGLVFEPLFADRLAVMVRTGHPLAARGALNLADLAAAQWILPRATSHPMKRIEAACAAAGFYLPAASVETQELGMIRHLLTGTDMLAIASPNQLLPEIRAGLVTVLPVALPGGDRDVGLVTRADARPSAAVWHFLATLRREASNLFGG